jgi:serine/threonine-protein kinase
MEYIEGISLKEYIEQRGVLDWNEALFFGIQILRALQHAHDKGIVHRDIKPQNIMLLENGTIKVTDFGIARFSHGETRTMTEKAIGSVHYISPEQAKGELTDEKADIYSVGIVFYEMLTGKLPFEADSAVSVALMQVNNDPTPPRSINEAIPLGFEQITLKAMEKNTRDRYQTAAEMLLDLEELKRNPNIKFDYTPYFVDAEPTRYIGKIQGSTRTTAVSQETVVQPPVKTVPPAVVNRKRVSTAQQGTRQQTVGAEDTAEASAKPKKTPIIAGVAFAVVIFILILIFSQLGNGSWTLGVGKKIEVDKFIGMNYEEEILNNDLYKDKYNFEVSYESFTDGKDGCVFKQDPEAGSEAAKGVTIRLYVAKSGEGVTIPDFEGENYQSAYNTLESMGFIVKLMPDTASAAEVGSVIKTDPSAGSSVFPGSNVYVYYAAADVGSLFKMPDLMGMSLDDAKKAISENGLVLGSVETVDTSEEKDRVVEQSPKNGSPVQKGDSVVLTVSSGKVSFEKNIDLPKNVGVLSVTVKLDGLVVANETADTNAVSSYNVKVSGDSKSELQVYLNDKLYFEGEIHFDKEPASIWYTKYHQVDFYVDVVGMNINEARIALSNAGYNNVTIQEQESDSAEGTVLGQSPSQGSAPNLDKTATIVLTIAKPKQSGSVDATVEDTSNEAQVQ